MAPTTTRILAIPKTSGINTARNGLASMTMDDTATRPPGGTNGTVTRPPGGNKRLDRFTNNIVDIAENEITRHVIANMGNPSDVTAVI